MNYHIRVYPLSQSWYASQIYTGLFDLHAAGRISLEFISNPMHRICERDWGHRNNESIVYLELIAPGRDVITVCYDMLDGPEIISLNGLQHCDVYFKRSFDHRFLVSEWDHWHEWEGDPVNKVLPYGMNCPVASKHEFANLKRAILCELATGETVRSIVPRLKSWIGEPVPALRHFGSRLLRGNENRRTPMLEIEPNTPAEDRILFQTRLFDPAEGKHFAAEFEALNRYRIEVLRAIKREFGPRLVGGFIPDALSKKECPDLLTTNRWSRAAYFKLVRECKVALFTRGLRQSTGWRLPEFFAASRCIVAEPLAYALPEPLVPGTNFLEFRSPDEAVAHCEQLFSEPGRAEQMRTEAFEYYRRNIRPDALILNSLNAAVAAVAARK
jgi:hypothetical protein